MAKLTPSQIATLKTTRAFTDETSGLYHVNFSNKSSVRGHTTKYYDFNRASLKSLHGKGLVVFRETRRERTIQITQAGRDALAELENHAQPAPKFAVGQRVHAFYGRGMVCYEVLRYWWHKELGEWVYVAGTQFTTPFREQALRPCDCPPDPAMCDICGEHQPHVATDSGNDVDVCEGCTDNIETNNYTRPAQAIASNMLPAFTMVHGELKTFAIVAKTLHEITRANSRLLLPAPQEYRPVDLDLWQQPTTEVDTMWIGQNLNDPDYRVWLGEKGLAKDFVMFVKDSQNYYSVYDVDALTVLKYVAPQSKARIWRLSYPKHAMSNQAWELSDVLELLRENHVSYMVVDGDETEMQFKVRGDIPAPTPAAHVVKYGGQVMVFGADKKNRRLAG